MAENKDNKNKKRYIKPKLTIKFLFNNLSKMRSLDKYVEETLLLAADEYVDEY